MSLVLGIDTGGTYTDAVVFDRTSRQVLAKAKSRTTRDDLSRGISGSIANLEYEDFAAIELVSMSTTLATNAIVEGAGCEVGLLMIGFEPDLAWKVPAAAVEVVPGGHNVKGLAKEPFDEALACEALERMRGNVDAVAISGYLSVRNPEHELAAKELVAQVLGLPVVCAHMLTRSLGIRERTTTAVLNAKLMPIIDNLLKSVRRSLDVRGIKAPIMVVRGDGTLIGEAKAKDKPIETMLSGPAASIIGSSFLSGLKDGYLLDMGGTTSDIAVIKDGIPRIDEQGARVGGFLTRVKAAAITTFGLGGDSYIQMDMERKLKVGPQRVNPICVAVSEYPYLQRELELIDLPFDSLLNHDQVVDCFQIVNAGATIVLTEMEKRALSTLEDGPHNIFEITRRMDTLPNLLDLSRLVSAGVLLRISLTPTDLLEAKDLLDKWDPEPSKLALEKLSRRFGIPSQELAELASDKVVCELCYACIQSLVNFEGGSFDIKEDPGASFFFSKQLHEDASSPIQVSITSALPLIGIGAPVQAWLPSAASRIGCKLTIPENSEVANAIGSAVGKVIESVKILIAPGDNNDGFTYHSSVERRFFEKLEDATQYGKEQAELMATENARASGAVNIECALTCEDVYAKSGADDNDIYLETHIEAVATEVPEWERGAKADHFFVDAKTLDE